jgi:hypothetical protein
MGAYGGRRNTQTFRDDLLGGAACIGFGELKFSRAEIMLVRQPRSFVQYKSKPFGSAIAHKTANLFKCISANTTMAVHKIQHLRDTAVWRRARHFF